MPSLLELLPNSQRAGVYQTDLAAEEIIAAAKTLDLHVVKIDLGRVVGKSALLDALAKSLRFPDYFGKNWDALKDCITDLSWISACGWVVILVNCKEFVEAHDEDFKTMLEVFNEAAEYWHEQKKPFWVIVQAQTDWEIALPKIVNN